MPKGSGRKPKKKVSQNGYQRAASIRASAMTDLAKLYPSSEIQGYMQGWQDRRKSAGLGPGIRRDVRDMMDIVSEGPSGTDWKWWTPYAIERFANDSAQMRRKSPRKRATPKKAAARKSRASKPAIDFGDR